MLVEPIFVVSINLFIFSFPFFVFCSLFYCYRSPLTPSNMCTCSSYQEQSQPNLPHQVTEEYLNTSLQSKKVSLVEGCFILQKQNQVLLSFHYEIQSLDCLPRKYRLLQRY
jgi:hypothetical protein